MNWLVLFTDSITFSISGCASASSSGVPMALPVSSW